MSPRTTPLPPLSDDSSVASLMRLPLKRAGVDRRDGVVDGDAQLASAVLVASPLATMRLPVPPEASVMTDAVAGRVDRGRDLGGGGVDQVDDVAERFGRGQVDGGGAAVAVGDCDLAQRRRGPAPPLRLRQQRVAQARRRAGSPVIVAPLRRRGDAEVVGGRAGGAVGDR